MSAHRSSYIMSYRKDLLNVEQQLQKLTKAIVFNTN